jgi:hypothetical protein
VALFYPLLGLAWDFKDQPLEFSLPEAPGNVLCQGCDQTISYSVFFPKPLDYGPRFLKQGIPFNIIIL